LRRDIFAPADGQTWPDPHPWSEVLLDPFGMMREAWRRMRRLLDFILNMDARAWRAVLVSFVLFGGVGLVFLFGAQILGFNGETTVEHWMGAANGPWALPVAVAAFAVLAFVGVPQFVLIAAAVVAFGPLTGMIYSWVGTVFSSVIGFGVGRVFGGKMLRDLGGQSVNRFIDLIGRNGFMASMIVRLVPSAPFVVINVAAGVTPMRLSAFTLGTGLGIVPKIVLTAYAGNAAMQATRGQGGQHFLILALAAALWIGAGWAARRWWKAREHKNAED
jgi:uncharacterized membrane protein YdjX (TVP38/TMEM64 family)